MFPPHFSIANLSTETIKPTHDLSQFDCSQNDVSGVNDFLQLEATRYQEENMGVTHLFFYEDELVGFVTISMTYVEKKETPDPKRLDYYGRKKPPAMLIGQLGVDNDARGRGLGRILCNWSEGKAIELSSEIGCRYLVLHTEQDLIAFYEKIGFETRKPEKQSPVMVKKLPRKAILDGSLFP